MIVPSGQNVMLVPCSSESPMRSSDRDRLAAVDERLRAAAAVALDLDLEPARQRVHDRHADAVQAAGDLVALAAELAAGVEHREHDLGRGLVGILGVRVDRDARGRCRSTRQPPSASSVMSMRFA